MNTFWLGIFAIGFVLPVLSFILIEFSLRRVEEGGDSEKLTRLRAAMMNFLGGVALGVIWTALLGLATNTMSFPFLFGTMLAFIAASTFASRLAPSIKGNVKNDGHTEAQE